MVPTQDLEPRHGAVKADVDTPGGSAALVVYKPDGCASLLILIHFLLSLVVVFTHSTIAFHVYVVPLQQEDQEEPPRGRLL